MLLSADTSHNLSPLEQLWTLRVSHQMGELCVPTVGDELHNLWRIQVFLSSKLWTFKRILQQFLFVNQPLEPSKLN